MVPSFVCFNDAPSAFPLNPNGTLTITGPGVTNNVLDPAAAGLGTHTYYYTFVDAVSGCTSTGSWRMDVVQCNIGLEDGAFKEWRLYPNPTQNGSALIVEVHEDTEITLAVYNMQGVLVQQVYSGPVSAGLEHHFDLDGNQLAAGVYQVILRNEADMKSHRWIIQR